MTQSVDEGVWRRDEGFCRLLTSRLEIRRFRPDDARGFAAYRSDPGVARYQGWDAPYPLSSARRFIEVMGESHPGTPGEWFQFAVARRDDGVLVGDCAAAPGADDPRVVEIGFSLARSHQGRGYATEAVGRLLDYLFEDEQGVRPVHRVTAGCDVRNTRSAVLLERVGMRREGHLVESEWFKGAPLIEVHRPEGLARGDRWGLVLVRRVGFRWTTKRPARSGGVCSGSGTLGASRCGWLPGWPG